MTTFPKQLANRAAFTIAKSARLVNTAHQRLNALGSQLSATSSSVSTNTSDISTLQEDVTALQDGGSWESMSDFSNSFSASGTLQYRTMPGGFVYISGSVELPSSGSYNDTVFFTMSGSDYVPAGQRNWACVPNAGDTYGNSSFPGAPTCFILSDGDMYLWGIPASLGGQSVNISGVYSL